MSAANDLDALAEVHGILPDFRDLSGTVQPTSPETKRALLRANGLVLDNDAMIAEALAASRHECDQRVHPREMVVESCAPISSPLSDGWSWHVVQENGETAEGRGEVPSLPSGVHTLTATKGGHAETITMIAAPGSCPSLEKATGYPRLWGINAALYAMRSERNGGIGDFEDLAACAEIFARHGADFVGINPVHSFGWADRTTISPYSPSHRGFLNTAHIATDRIFGLPLAEITSPPDGSEWIAYGEISRAHRERLCAHYEAFETDATTEARAAFAAFCQTRGPALEQFALYEASSEAHGAAWIDWPINIEADAPCVRFHQWLQWVADTQLAGAQDRARQAGMGLGLYLDLAVGARRGGAESWCERESTAQGVSLGAPPDHLSPDGQNWQLAAYAPAKLSAKNYAPLRRIIAETMRHAGVLRIDHVLGMNRSYWIPDDGSPGGYIRQPLEALLAIVAIEAERAGTVVIGEDLGLVPQGFREALRARGLYSYSVLQYERDGEGGLRHPDDLRPDSLLCFGTHDTPTMHGFWTGRDIDWWRKLGWIDADGAKAARARRAQDKRMLARYDGTAAPAFGDVKDTVHRAMAASPVAMVSVQLDDLCNQVEAQNLPGTIDEHPNWRRRCPVPVERLDSDLDLGALGGMMAGAGRGREPKDAEEERRND